MINALPRILSRVRHNPITIAVEPLLGSSFGGKGQEPAQQSLAICALCVPAELAQPF